MGGPNGEQPTMSEGGLWRVDSTHHHQPRLQGQVEGAQDS